MTTLTLPEILQRLREQPITRVKVSLDGKCGEIAQMDADALYAQLLAVCNALESSIKLHDSHNDLPTVINITQKLAAALKL